MAATKPVAIVCVGMAGSGKTTFMQRINSHLHSRNEPPYVINLDPAVRNVPFDSNIDIRDSVNYREVMKQYNLGPNGGILTSLNLFATKIDQILALLERRTGTAPKTGAAAAAEGEAGGAGGAAAAGGAGAAPAAKPIKNILVDTPGQIEVFVWSASGDILLGSLASSFPTVIAYVVDTPRTTSTSTFMSNMLYACSIMYKTKLPMILVMNKTDVQDAEFAREWMTDFEKFQDALRNEEGGSFGGEGGGAGGGTAFGGGGSGYMGSLLNSMSLVLEEFYRHLSMVGVSSMTGDGVDDFFAAVGEKAEEFERDYRPELERRQAERVKEKEAKRERELGRLMKDMNVSGASSSGSRAKGPRKAEPETISDVEDDEEEEEFGEVEDSDDGEEEGRERDDGLVQRYRQAMRDDVGDEADLEAAAKYLGASRMG